MALDLTLSPEFLGQVAVVGVVIGTIAGTAWRQFRKTIVVEKKTDHQTSLLNSIASDAKKAVEAAEKARDEAREGVQTTQSALGRIDQRLITSQGENTKAHDGYEKRLNKIEEEIPRVWKEVSKQQEQLTVQERSVHRTAAELALLKQAGSMRRTDTAPLGPDPLDPEPTVPEERKS